MIPKRRTFNTGYMLSRVPEYQIVIPQFYRCAVCGSVYVCYGRRAAAPAGQTTDGLQGMCCGHPLMRLTPCTDEVLIKGHQLQYCIFGGTNHNTIKVDVCEGEHAMTAVHHIDWIFLYSFLGGQMKYLPPGRKSSAMFTMAEEDAFAFCGRDICKMGWETCNFQCKRGHVAYAYCSKDGLFELKF